MACSTAAVTARAARCRAGLESTNPRPEEEVDLPGSYRALKIRDACRTLTQHAVPRDLVSETSPRVRPGHVAPARKQARSTSAPRRRVRPFAPLHLLSSPQPRHSSAGTPRVHGANFERETSPSAHLFVECQCSSNNASALTADSRRAPYAYPNHSNRQEAAHPSRPTPPARQSPLILDALPLSFGDRVNTTASESTRHDRLTSIASKGRPRRLLLMVVGPRPADVRAPVLATTLSNSFKKTSHAQPRGRHRLARSRSAYSVALKQFFEQIGGSRKHTHPRPPPPSAAAAATLSHEAPWRHAFFHHHTAALFVVT